MTTQTATYQIDVRENLTAAMRAAADALAQTGTAGTKAYTQITAGLNATSKATATLNNEWKAQAGLLNAQAQALRAETAQQDAATRAVNAGTAALNAQTRATAQAARDAQTLSTAHRTATQSSTSLWQSIAGGVAVGNLATRLFTELASGAVNAGRAIVENTAALEQSRIAFTQLLGSADAADKFISQLQGFAAKTPFNFSSLRQYAQQLIGTGTAARDVIPIMTDLGNAVAGVGGNNATLQRVVLAYEQIQTKGKLAGDEARQLAEAGIPVWDILSKQLGVSAAKVQELSQDGQITADVFDQAFHAEAITRWGGQMDAASHSLQGITSNLQDLGEQLSAKLGGPAVQVLEQELAHLVDDLSKPEVGATLDEWGVNLGKAAQAAASLWDTFAAGARQALEAARPITDLIGQLIGGLPDVPVPNAPTPTADPYQPATDGAKDLGDQLTLNTAKAYDYKKEIQGAQDQLDGVRRAQQDSGYLLDQSIAGERNKLSLLQQQYEMQDRATSVKRLQAKIAQDEALGQNLFSSAGAAARQRLTGEREQLEDAQTAQARAGEKNRAEAHISSLEDQKKADEHRAQLQERAIQDTITMYQRAAAFEKEENDRRAKRATEAREQDKQRQQAADDLAKAQDKLYQQLQTLDYGYQTTSTATHGAVGAFDLLNERITAFQPLQEAANAAGREWKKLMEDAPAEAGQAGQAIKDLAKALGLNEEGAKNAKKAWNSLLDAFVISTPILLKKVSNSIHDLTDDLTLLADTVKVLMTVLPAQQGKPIDLQAYVNAGTQLQRDQDTSTKRRNQAATDLFNTEVNAGTQLGKQLQTDLQGPETSHPTGTYTTGGSFGQSAVRGLERDENGRPIRGHATGGWMAAGEPGIIGEGGPEYWQPDHSGTVIPTGSFGGAARGGNNGPQTITVQTICLDCQRKEMTNVIRRNGELIATVVGRHTRGERHQ